MMMIYWSKLTTTRPVEKLVKSFFINLVWWRHVLARGVIGDAADGCRVRGAVGV